MKKLSLTTCLIFCLCVSQIGYAQHWAWAKGVNCTPWTGYYSGSYGCFVKACDNGNVYTAGVFSGDFSLQPGIEYHYPALTLSDMTRQIFVAKYDSSGNILWSQASLYGKSNYTLGMTADNYDNMYLVGYFDDSIKFGTLVLKRADTFKEHIFLVKFDPNGNVVWGKNIGGVETYGSSLGSTSSLITSDGNNIYAALPFDNGLTKVGSIPVICHGTSDLLIAKFDNMGNALWANAYGGTNIECPAGIAFDAGQLYVTGIFCSPSVFLAPGITLTNTGYSQTCFLLKSNTAGNIAWAKASSKSATPYCITTDRNNFIYIGGILNSKNVMFGSLPLDDSDGSFIVKYDQAGNSLLGKSFSTPGGRVEVHSLAVDFDNNIWVSGGWPGNSKTGMSELVLNDHTKVTPPHSQYSCAIPAFMAQLSPSFNVSNYTTVTNSSFYSSLSSDNKGYIYVTGELAEDTTIFDGNILLNCLMYNSVYYVAKYSAPYKAPVGVDATSHPLRPVLFPNPAENEINVDMGDSDYGNATVFIYDITGRLLQETSLSGIRLTIPLNGFAPGTYICKIVSGLGKTTVFQQMFVVTK